MGTYGRNFDFRITPRAENRQGRFSTNPTNTYTIPIGAPVAVNVGDGNDGLGRQYVELASGAQAPIKGQTGVALYEYAPAAFAGVDPFLTTFSDLDVVPIGKPLQVVDGSYVKVVLTNTAAFSFLGQRNYAGRTMVAGMGATPTVVVGNYLTPGLGTDSGGYWAVTATASQAWLVVTSVDATRQEVEARLMF